MTLATRCPQCQTVCRVTPDQLKLRAGLIRCTGCKEIFNGSENLLPVGQHLPAEQLPALAANPVVAVMQVKPSESSKIPEPVSSPLPGLLRAANTDGEVARPVLPVSKPGSSGSFKRSSKPGLKPAQTAFRNSARKNTATKTTAPKPAPVEEPDFIQREQIEQSKQRLTRPLLLTLCTVLALIMALQLAYATRTSLAASFPQSRLVLEKACKLIGCSVGLPMQIDSVSIESSELQPLENTPGKFILTVLLRNRGTTVQAWPAIELSVQDRSDKTIGRRVIVATEFLPAGPLGLKGFAANSEQPIRINLDLAQLSASGYRVYLFYP